MCWGAPLKNVSVFTDWVLRVMGHFAFFACHSSCGIVRCTAPCFSFVSLGSNSCGLCLALCLLGRRLRFVCLCMLQPCVCMPVLFVLFVVCTCCTLVYLACLLFSWILAARLVLISFHLIWRQLLLTFTCDVYHGLSSCCAL